MKEFCLNSAVGIFLAFLTCTSLVKCQQKNHSTHSHKTIHMVISSYNEPFSPKYPFENDKLGGPWLLKYVDHFTLYRRGEDPIPPEYNAIQMTENVGREGYIYLKYIIDHYDNLSDLTLFTQADRLHEDDFFSKDFVALFDGKLHMGEENDGVAYMTLNCLKAGYGVGFDDPKTSPRYFYNIKVKVSDDRPEITVRDLYKAYFKPPFETPDPRFSECASLAVTKHAILRNSKEHYLHLIRILNRENNPEVGIIIERSWPAIFHSRCTAGKTYNCKIPGSWSSEGQCDGVTTTLSPEQLARLESVGN